MESSTPSREDEFVASFAFQRQRLLSHAASLLGASTEGREADKESMSRLAQTLVSSLEVLKVAEQELVDQQRRYVTLEKSQNRQLAHFRAIFALAPTPLILTTTDTSIREANVAATKLIGYDAHQLEGRQLASFVPRAHLAAFRDQLKHVLEMGRVAAWSFTLDVQRNLPVVITAIVDVIEEPALGSRALYWNIRPIAV
jgi:PAS domain S-box-containing protein